MAGVTSRDGRNGAWLEPVADNGAELVVTIGGEVDISSVAPLRTALEGILDRQPTKLIFELRELRFMDSSGIALLITAAQRVGRVELHHPSAMVRRVIELAGLATTLPMTQ
jgi:anti-sigma B factor antagonist